ANNSKPQDKDVEAIIERNIRLVISMIGNHRPPTVFAQEPLRLLWLQTYDTILTPIPISKLLQGVQKALPIIQNGKGILCYCAQGRHHSVAMGASILVSMGYSTEEAMDYLRAQRKVAHPQAWHIQRHIEQFEELWQPQNEQPIQVPANPEA
ncbi:MAG: dual specificity protein phosphatase family protein, partial [Chloroflexi bacterium]|nr:dual specificity protein phosphatase family protein [Chloroflexota bacterium]